MMTFTALQSRIIGVMMEKEITTPEQYPLSLNALTNGCNQKSNRDPVMQLSETEVQNGIDELIEMKQLMLDSAASGRVHKYKHRFCNTPFSNLQLTDQQKSIICMLFLRGPQTPGELRTRTNRLATFSNVNEVEGTLEQLQDLNNSQLVKKLAREPGKRDCRYIHLFSEHSETESIEKNSSIEILDDNVELENRVTILEQEVNHLKSELLRLSALID